MRILDFKFVWVLILASFLVHILPANCQEHEISGGIRVQKAVHLYWENGLTAEYTNSHLWEKRLHIGLTYCTSRLGTAYHTNAIKQDNYLLFATLNFREQKHIQPILKLNTGFFYSDMEYEIFKVLPHKSPLISLETGLGFKLKYPIKLTTSFGYNFITGNGISGPGTLYPFFYQFSLLYVINWPKIL